MSEKRKKQNIVDYGSEFRKFINKGDIFDLAAAIVIGAAFNAIVTSLANNMITPFISYFISDINLSDLKLVLRNEILNEAGEVISSEISVNYGSFLQAVVQFLITAIFVFIVLKIIKAARTHFEKIENAAKAGVKRRKRFLFWKVKQDEPEEPKKEEPKKPTEAELLEKILKEIQIQNGTYVEEEADDDKADGGENKSSDTASN